MGIAEFLEKIKPFIAISILLFLVFAVVGMNKEIKLNKEIKESCGYYKNETVFCVCDKNLIKQIPLHNNPYYEEKNISEIQWD